MFEQDLEGLNRHREQTVEDIKELLKTNQRVACVRYTGYGKSYYIVRKLIEEIDGQKIIVVPNDTLKLHYQEQYKDNKSVIILTYQIIKNKTTEYIQNEYTDVSLIVADECHHITAKKWTKEFQRLEDTVGAKVIGLTATPERGNRINVVDKFFKGVEVKPLDLLEGISLGFVPKIKYIIAYASLDDKRDLIDNKMKDIDRYRISNLLKVENILKEEIPEEYLENNLKILVFVPKISNIKEGRYKSLNWFKIIYPNKVINIYSIDSKTSVSKNENQLNEFKKSHDNNTIDIMISVNKLIEGLHMPSVNIEILLRKTESSVVYFQQIGRVINSKQPIVFDLINNTAHLHHIKDEYEINSRYVANINKYTGHKKKIMYEDCIELIYRTIEIDDILKKYKYSIKDILLQNKEYIEKNPDNLSKKSMSKKFNMNIYTLQKWCSILDIDLITNYARCRKRIISILNKNKKYIEENPDKLSRTQMRKHIQMCSNSFKSYCSELNIDITSNYTIREKITDKDYYLLFNKNKKYIEENPDKLSRYQICKQLHVSIDTFKSYCSELNIDITSNYTTKKTKDEIISILNKNKRYIEENPDKLFREQVCDYFQINSTTFKNYCSKLNIDVFTNYKNIKKKDEITSIIIKNRKYIEENPDNYTYEQMCDYLNISVCAFKKYCKICGVHFKHYYRGKLITL